jgi:tellurite resistance protein TerC
LLAAFHWVIYVFGVFLVMTAIRLAFGKDEEVHPELNPVLRIFRRLVPVTPEYVGSRFLVKRDGRWLATPLLMVLVVIEATDVVFAVDSIPAILAVSHEPFIVFASNAFAILGLRALYFCLAGMAGRFRYLNRGLGVILAFVGVKMLLLEVVHVPTFVSLGVIAAVLAVAIALSVRADRRAPVEPAELAH